LLEAADTHGALQSAVIQDRASRAQVMEVQSINVHTYISAQILNMLDLVVTLNRELPKDNTKEFISTRQPVSAAN
jgi:hypothetical protein